jgi:hypothetical protein
MLSTYFSPRFSSSISSSNLFDVRLIPMASVGLRGDAARVHREASRRLHWTLSSGRRWAAGPRALTGGRLLIEYPVA